MTTSRDLFLKQCHRRFGTSNPERMRLEHWEWMVRHGGGPYEIRMELGLEDGRASCCGHEVCMDHGPDWCFSRLGMTRTAMDDGRIICVGGEHEDYYDSDFCIYNDVIVLRPESGKTGVSIDSGEVEIYGYPEATFPPTDFHTATLVGDRLIVIGRLGYQGKRGFDRTPVFSVDTSTYEVTELKCTGDQPGWIYKHHASLEPNSRAITVRGGYMLRPGDEKIQRVRSVHRLHLADLRWELVSATDEFREFEIDSERSGAAREPPHADDFRPTSVPHIWLQPEDRGVEVYLLDVLGARITFEDWSSAVGVTIEGTLPRETIEALLDDIVANLGRRGGVWRWREVNPNHER